MMAERYNAPPMGSSFSNRSPLETLVRKSSQRAHAASETRQEQRPGTYQTRSYSPPTRSRHQDAASPRPFYPEEEPPSSPLLHSSFNRDSVATASVFNDGASSYLDLSRDSIDWRNPASQQGSMDWSKSVERYRAEGIIADDASVYSRGSAFVPEPALRDSWKTSATSGNGPPSPYGPTHASSSRSSPHLPSVVVSSPYADDAMQDEYGTPQPRKGGRAPIQYDPAYASSSPSINLKEQQQPRRAPIIRSLSNSSNYSMPIRAPMQAPMRAAPLASAEDEQDRKRAILARNGGGVKIPPLQTSPSQPPLDNHHTPSYKQPSYYQQSSSLPSPTMSRSSSPSYSPVTPNTPNSIGNTSLHPPPSHMSSSRSPEQVVLPRKPPSIRPDSPASLYDRYSYYDLGSTTPPDGERSRQASPRPGLSPQPSKNNLRTGSSPLASQPITGQGDSNEPNLTNPSTAWDYLHLGINAHLASKPSTNKVSGSPKASSFKKTSRRSQPGSADNEQSLRESAIYFEKSATINGGCTLGMLMWGMALRHGWGVAPREKDAFMWLRKAAEGALGSANGSSDNLVEKSAMVSEKGLGPDIKSELVVAIYEVGQCFFQGWGVPKDKAMAVSYYRTAARLGDADAQNDLAFCLANGKGCKKDRKEAAKWYRAAVAQGQSDVGLAWIYKEKFQD